MERYTQVTYTECTPDETRSITLRSSHVAMGIKEIADLLQCLLLAAGYAAESVEAAIFVDD